MFTNSTLEWAHQTFAHAYLGDARRTKRLVQLANDMASNIGKSIVQACKENPASIEGAYRLIRNDKVCPQAIAEAGFASTVESAKDYELLLALEDTTSLTYTHKKLTKQLGHVNSGDRCRGLQVHSVLLWAPEEQHVVGLVEQQRWVRDVKTRGRGNDHAKRPYEEKESYKWQKASEAMAKRCGDLQSRIISVCDRESDIYEYLQYKIENQQRFVVRSTYSRCIEQGTDKLYEYASTLESAGERIVHIPQRGGRKSRNAVLDVRFAQVTLKVPANKRGSSIPLYYVGCSEPDGLQWHLLTSEPVTTAAQAQRILDFYEQRWLVEEFHKAWKSGGTDVEGLQLQSKSNLERVAVIQAFISIRLLQLRATCNESKRNCEAVLGKRDWKLLWLKVEKKPLPEMPPSIEWAKLTLAKLGGWYDSKRTGRPGWAALWQGWYELALLIEGYLMAQSLASDEI